VLSIFVHVIERLSSVVLTHGHVGQILLYLRVLTSIILFKINTGLGSGRVYLNIVIVYDLVLKLSLPGTL
jgi:hypothetical protein